MGLRSKDLEQIYGKSAFGGSLMTTFGWTCIIISSIFLILTHIKSKNMVSPIFNEVHMSKKDIRVSVLVGLSFMLAYMPRNILIHCKNLDSFLEKFPYTLVYSLSVIGCPFNYCVVCTTIIVRSMPTYNVIVKRKFRELFPCLTSSNQITVYE